jgi:16S rRNA (adenine(1408)-N(1))-methyltransferase
VMATARSEPTTLAIGVDADASRMVEASRRALAPLTRGGVANALFVVAAIERLPPELDTVADHVTIHFPWGSLLSGLVSGDERVVGGLAGIARLGARVRLLLSILERDRLGAVSGLDDRSFESLDAAYRRHGLRFMDVRPATPEEIDASRSSWAKRLDAGRTRPALLVDLLRERYRHGPPETMEEV